MLPRLTPSLCLRLSVLLGTVLALVAVPSATPSIGSEGPPTSIAALGDSISRGLCTDATCAERPENSWSTGTNRGVDSQLLRLRASLKNKVPAVRAFNFASSEGATMADLAAQARRAVRSGAEYVTIEMGANDLCNGTPTSPAVFRRELERGLALLTFPHRHYQPKILLLSLENEAAHWRVLRADPVAVKAFENGAVLGCGLGYYTATKTLLSRIDAQAKVLNTILADVCSKQPFCFDDNGTYFRLPLKASYFSPADYQHLSIDGQRALAAAEWRVAQSFLYR
jgi:lysophospholipase L1-like esterase